MSREKRTYKIEVLVSFLEILPIDTFVCRENLLIMS